MRRKVISVILASVMLVSFAVSIFASDLPEDYCLYKIDGMQRVFATSSYSPEHKDAIDTALIFDHRTGTGITFDYTGKDEKKFSIIIGSLDHEKIEKIAMLVEHDENTSVDVALYVCIDASFTAWMPVSLNGEGKTDGWNIISVGELTQGYAFYRLDFDIIEGESFDIKEIALFRTAEKPAEVVDSSALPFYEKEQWRKALVLKNFRKF